MLGLMLVCAALGAQAEPQATVPAEDGEAAAAAATGGSSIVVRASGPSAHDYPVGKSLANGSKIILRAGDSITLLDAHGSRTMRGPGTFTVGSATAGANATMRARVGAVRGGGPEPAERVPTCPGDPRCPELKQDE